MKLLDGHTIANAHYEVLKTRVLALDRTPSLAVVLVGDDYASQLYVKLKEKAAKKVGIDFHKYFFADGISENELIESISFLRNDNDIDAILVQMPLPVGYDTHKIVAAMGARKDVDGFHPHNIKQFIAGDDVIYPVFPQALLTLAEASGTKLEGKNAVIVGHSDLFTQAMVAACTREGLVIHKVRCDAVATMHKVISHADIIFTACGTPNLITADIVKEDAIVIDGGISAVGEKTVGDVAFDSVAKKASYLTPVPGGVGPVTIACLLENVVILATQRDLS